MARTAGRANVFLEWCLVVPDIKLTGSQDVFGFQRDVIPVATGTYRENVEETLARWSEQHSVGAAWEEFNALLAETDLAACFIQAYAHQLIRYLIAANYSSRKGCSITVYAYAHGPT